MEATELDNVLAKEVSLVAHNVCNLDDSIRVILSEEQNAGRCYPCKDLVDVVRGLEIMHAGLNA